MVCLGYRQDIHIVTTVTSIQWHCQSTNKQPYHPLPYTGQGRLSCTEFWINKSHTHHHVLATKQRIVLFHLSFSVRIKGDEPPLRTSGIHMEGGGFCRRWVCSSCRRNTGANGLPSVKYFCHKRAKTSTHILKLLASASLTFTTVISVWLSEFLVRNAFI